MLQCAPNLMPKLMVVITVLIAIKYDLQASAYLNHNVNEMAILQVLN